MKLIRPVLLLYCASFILPSLSMAKGIVVGAEQTDNYLSLLKGKKVGLMLNQTSMVENTNLFDFLLSKGITVAKVFSVEHGFMGDFSDGKQIGNSTDKKTGLPIISLYGEKKKPTPKEMAGLDIVVFDIQDVGCRFYTYISSLHYLMEACAENKVKLLILDRPNPNGDYVDGPVLKPQFKSFVGMDPIPIVHGCTIGELALMINGEGWLKGKKKCEIEVIKVKNYTHSTLYEPPVKPSPNLPNYLSIRLYPSLCLFEATNISVGRGTDFPFQVIGFPNNSSGNFKFTPKSIPGTSDDPIFKGMECKGTDLRNMDNAPRFTLTFFISFFHQFQHSAGFWKSERWINLLTGSNEFYQQINKGLNADQIKVSWQSDLKKYKLLRKKYLLYPDFE